MLFNEPVEQAVLACSFVAPDLAPMVAALPEAYFATGSAQTVHQAIRELVEEGTAIDYMLVQSRAAVIAGHWPGCLNYLVSLDMMLPDVGRFASLVHELKLWAARRELHKTGAIVMERALSDDPAEVAMDGANNLLNIDCGKSASGSQEFMEHADVGFAGGTPVPCGLPTIDRLFDGGANAGLAILAALMGMGKTSFAMYWMDTCCHIENRPALFISLEMKKLEMGQRLLSCRTGIPYRRIKTGDLSPSETERYEDERAFIRDAGTFNIWDKSNKISLTHLLSLIRSYRYRGECDFVVIDHLRHVSYGLDHDPVEGLGVVTSALHTLAKDLSIPILLLHQINRGSVQAGVRPELHNLRGSDGPGQDADSVSYIWSPPPPEGEEENMERCEEKYLEFYTPKFRSGKSGWTVPIVFKPWIMHFEEGSYDY